MSGANTASALTHVLAGRLDVANLAVSLQAGGSPVVSDVSFRVSAGELLGVVGESGSGKTTLALALLGHARRGLKITSGNVLLDGVDVLALRGSDLRELRGAKASYVPQDPAAALNPALRVGTQLREVLTAHRSKARDVDARLREVLREVRLDPDSDLLGRYAHQLSGGQQQRVALAMAFACRPGLIVLDEPTTGLDVSTQRHVLETVRALCDTYGVAGVYVSHDLAVVGDLVSNVAVMYAGRIVELGKTRTVFLDPVHPYTRGLLAAVPSPERAEVLTGIEGYPPRPGHRPPGCPFAPRCGHALDYCYESEPEVSMVMSSLVRCHRALEIRDERPARIPLTELPALDAPPVLSLRGLSARYGSYRVLADIDLDVAPERCLAIVGESGSGKTTLARCIVGLHANWTGGMRFEGDALAAGATERPRETLRRIQYVFQNPYTSLNPRKTVRQIIGQLLQHHFALTRRECEERSVQALNRVALGGGVLARYPDELSGGERQRVAIARALVLRPHILVCDEVTSALDVSVQATVVELLREVQQDEKLALIFITHNLALVRSIAQTAIVLSTGRVVESGSVEAILERPSHPYTRQLITDVPKLSSR